ncbi:LLM class F420-dependent oxidoreductase [Williamsia phyllosphaerae]|uniref:LLM class F420-dependent oxidoreductase n=1 Tax=Williamsia phyllosphaerae TaxID=885042 RepID=A0ABQ1USI2_9NOCA|nr:LLM class F420-dependent oxidoreductase [Williamsia phyllosphaerae]GGF25111.1 LLM class F420-dependent oxidoreductase [Williamsia phyllosphaerae]
MHGFGTHGVWTGFSTLTGEQAARIEQLGYGTIWLGGSAPTLAPVRAILEATDGIRVATGITNIWNTEPAAIAGEFASLETDFPGRFYLGIGVGHREATQEYASPYQSMVAYLDVLDDAGVPADRRILAALGPKMLRLSADRALGAHPYLTTPAHTAYAREILGPDALLAPEHKIVLDTDPVTARAIGRPPVDTPYLHLANYVANLKRLGYADSDIADGGSDALIDDLVAHGDSDAIRDKVDAHLAAGADHVAIQVLGAPESTQDITDVLEQLTAG